VQYQVEGVILACRLCAIIPAMTLTKKLAMFFAIVVLAMIAASQFRTVRADSDSSHFVLVQGNVSFPNGVPHSTLFRMDTQSGQVYWLAQGKAQSGGLAYAWTKVIEPQN
jgi:hypothetical protein